MLDGEGGDEEFVGEVVGVVILVVVVYEGGFF